MVRKIKKPESNNKEEIIYVDKPIPRSGPITKFKTYKEEAIHVLKILKDQGVNIYEEGRYGGMYLKGKNNIPQIFIEDKPNNNEIPESDLEEFFKN